MNKRLNDATPDEWDRTKSIMAQATKGKIYYHGKPYDPVTEEDLDALYNVGQEQEFTNDNGEDTYEEYLALKEQIGGSHYKKCAIQPVEYTIRNGLGFCEGNVIKYVTRYKSKGGKKDLRKAIHYLEILLENCDDAF